MSSHAIKSASLITAKALGENSSRLPIGVAIRYISGFELSKFNERIIIYAFDDSLLNPLNRRIQIRLRILISRCEKEC